MTSRKSSFIKSVFYAIGAQVVSLSASLVISFIAPKLIDVSNYAYWQLFLFYVTYINITRLGLIDGLYLRLGGKKYEDLDHNKLSVEWLMFVIFQLIIAIFLFIVIICSNMNSDRKFVFGVCCFCMVLINSNNYFSFILQAVNKTRKYSMSIIIQNLTWFIAIFIIIFFKIYSYKVIVLCYVLGHIIAGIYLALNAKEVWHVKKYSIKLVISDIKENVKCGIFLMISLFAGNLIIGSARMIIDNAWGVEVFGYFSFSLTLANFVLTFINQISLVLFPALKSLALEKQEETYELFRKILGIILPIMLFGYVPICMLIKWWLPQYTESLKYLVFFLPICTYDGKMQMLCSTYFKVLRKEKFLMIINCVTMLISITIALIGCYFIRNIYFVASGILFAIALRSIISEIYLAKLMNKKIKIKIVQETILVLSFIFITLIFKNYISLVLFSIVYFIYLIINKNEIIELYQNIKKKK